LSSTRTPARDELIELGRGPGRCTVRIRPHDPRGVGGLVGRRGSILRDDVTVRIGLELREVLRRLAVSRDLSGVEDRRHAPPPARLRLSWFGPFLLLLREERNPWTADAKPAKGGGMAALKSYGEWALVTGASAGIGTAFARKLASQG